MAAGLKSLLDGVGYAVGNPGVAATAAGFLIGADFTGISSAPAAGGSVFTLSLSDTITLSDLADVVVPQLPPFPSVFLGGGGTEIGHPRMRVLKPERRDDDIEELEIVEILTCWLGKN